MEKSPYVRFTNTEMILRDELAIDRTVLANERTLLAYLRSGVALVIAGVSIMHFSERLWFWVTGVSCIPIGILTAIIGAIRYQQMRRAISAVRKNEAAARTLPTHDTER